MTIQRIMTSPVELTTLGGVYDTVDTTKFDPTRTRGVFKHHDGEISLANFPAVSGTVTWLHFTHTIQRRTSLSYFWSDRIIEVKDASGLRMFYVDINPTMNWRALVDSGTATSQVTQQVLSEGTLMAVDIKLTIGANVTAELYFNGALQGTATIANTQGAGNPTSISFGVYDTSTGSGGGGYTWFGEFIIADEDTRGFRMRELQPQSFGVFQQWDGTVASVYDDSLATGVSTDVADGRVSFGLDNLDGIGAGDIINRVVVQSYAQRGASGLTSINHFFRYDDSFVQDGANIALATTGNWYVDEYVNNPRTAVAWTPADLAGIQLGVRART